MLFDGSTCPGKPSTPRRTKVKDDASVRSLSDQRDNVRFESKADICSAKGHVRFTPDSDTDCVFRHVCFGPKADMGANPIGYSMTSSARSRKDSRTERPSALAVLRLTASSNLSGDWTGKLPIGSPLR